MKKTYLLLIIFLVPFFLSAKEKSFLQKSEFGLYGGLNFNFHTPDFIIADSNLVFDNNSNSLNGHFGFIYRYLIDDMFTISGRLGYNGLGGTIEASDLNSTELLSSLSYFELSPILEVYNLIPVDNLYLLGGLEFGFPVSGSYEISKTEQDIPDLTPRVALALGAGYKYEVSQNMFLSPELSFRLPFSNVSSSSDFDSWNIPQLRLGVSFTFGFSDYQSESKIDGLEIGFRDVAYLDKDGNKNKLEKITVEQQNYGELFPIIPYVFYEPGSKVPSSNTQEMDMNIETGGFTFDNLNPDAIEINKHTLDIIGSRMQEYPDAKIKIKGTYAGDDEKENIELAEERADFAKQYLMMNYNVSEDRIKVESMDKPSQPSTYKVQDGIEENRRIEIEGNDNLLAPIMIEKEDRTIPNPGIIYFEPFAETDLPIANWELSIYQADRELESIEASGFPHEYTWNIKPNQLEANNIPVDYVLKVYTLSGKQATETGTIPVDYYSKSRMKSEERANRTITKFSLVVFDFDSPEVSDHDKDILKRNVIPEIKYNSTVQIYGYSDRIGNEDYNTKLALQRAENVMEYLKKHRNDIKYEVYGVGEKVEIFDNDLPIGRQLSRTVQVYVITPNE